MLFTQKAIVEVNKVKAYRLKKLLECAFSHISLTHMSNTCNFLSLWVMVMGVMGYDFYSMDIGSCLCLENS